MWGIGCHLGINHSVMNLNGKVEAHRHGNLEDMRTEIQGTSSTSKSICDDQRETNTCHHVFREVY
jgi:hypothetical protein